MVTEIIVGVAVAISAIVSLVMCVCGKDQNARSPLNSINLDRAEDNNNDKRDEEEVAIRERTGDTRTDNIDPDRSESVRPKTLTINRKLPEIPQSVTTTAAMESIATDLYATVYEATARNEPNIKTSSTGTLNSPVPSTSSVKSTIHHNHHHHNQNCADRSRPLSTIMTNRPAQIFEQKHNYAKIKGQTSDDRDTDTDTYCDPQVYADASGNVGAVRSYELTSALYEPPPPPVPEKYFEPSIDAAGSAQPNSSLSAANAIAGNPSIADIPFMTSPVTSNRNLNFIEDSSSETYTRGSDNVLQEIRYTSISVREPLANIRAQMIQQPTTSSSMTSGGGGRNASAASSASASTGNAVIVESHYSVVPEEVDQTYAEIESAQHSATSSMTYSRIVDANNQRASSMPTPINAASGNYPPAPPTVESLRTVAQAHSRHASSSSCISEGSHHNSPASTDRSFEMTASDGTPISCGPDVAGRSSSASPDFSAIYSVVDKSKKFNRSTVHVMEAAPDQFSVTSNGGDRPRHHHHHHHHHHQQQQQQNHHNPNSVTSIEDMYAKVTKKRGSTGARPKRPNTTIDANNHQHQHLINQISTGSQSTANVGVIRRQSSGRDDYFGYEKIRDPTENRRHEDIAPFDVFDGVEIRRKYPVASNNDDDDYDDDDDDDNNDDRYSNDSKDDYVDDPNYEVVAIKLAAADDDNKNLHGHNKEHDRSDTVINEYPNYETIEETCVSSKCRANYSFEDDRSESENGYEHVSNNGRDDSAGVAFSRSDPNYESVRYATARVDPIEIAEVTEIKPPVPGAEVEDETSSAAAAASHWSEALYEKITDPNYANAKAVSESSNETSEFGYESVPPKRKLFEVEDGYERIRDGRREASREGGGGFASSRNPASEPGYESITERIDDSNSASIELGLEDDDDDDEEEDALYAVPLKPAVRKSKDLRPESKSDGDEKTRAHRSLESD